MQMKQFFGQRQQTQREIKSEKGVEKERGREREGAETINMAKLATRRWSADYSTGWD